MPTYTWGCECGRTQDELHLGLDNPPPLTCNCGRVMTRQFTPCTALMFAPDADPKTQDMRDKHSAWYRSEVTQAKIRSGELRHLTSNDD